MTLQERGAPRAAWVERLGSRDPLTTAGDFVRKTLVVVEVEMRKLRHDSTEVISRAAQPALWLLVFGQVMNQMRAIPTGGLPYIDFLAPGILAQSVLFIAIFYGIAIIWERDLGIVQKFLVSPAPRTAQVLGKGLAAGVRALAQALIIYALAALMGVDLNWNPLALLGVAAVVVCGAAVFSLFSLLVACLVKTRERFMGFGQVMTMPLFFASNAIYPVSLMPSWLQVIARLNPLTYEVDALRALMLRGGTSVYGVGMDLLVLVGIAAVLAVAGGRLYPNVVT